MSDNRIELNEQELESVIGGAFHYFQKNGYNLCYVDGIGTFFASANAFTQIAAHASDTSLTSQQIVDWAVEQGYLSNKPI